ncbi:CsbD family protein [Arthrobacter zhaoguopingii]|uniref:CsbD family protein n=1 Tax=Arthrobacter zhaoguopingii TaxID=2681491 RepID=UPI001356DEDA|nr:CsbD family protein [Arthrobacter zhaoguopingii]
MGLDDKVGNKGEGLGGKIKEGLGKATGDQSLEAEGHKDQTKASLKDAGENIKDAFKKGDR